MMIGNCRNCFWWNVPSDSPMDKAGEPYFGECRAAPPHAAIRLVDEPSELVNKGIVTVWPCTKAHDGCGGYLSCEVAQAMIENRAKALCPDADDIVN